MTQGTRYIRQIDLEARICECCLGNDLESLWHQIVNARPRNAVFGFSVSNVICRDCGFVFVSPVFSPRDLEAYYGDSFGALGDAQPDYNIEARLSLLNRIAPGRGRFVEVGSNLETEFHKSLLERFQRVDRVELNNSVERECETLSAIATGSVDVVAHYFVLEHVPHVAQFLAECRRALRSGGIMVCEVPDIEQYERNPSALQLHEHTNHFSKSILQRVASRSGLELLEWPPEPCSRPFGFVSVFRKTNVSTRIASDASEYLRNKHYFEAGLEKVRLLNSALDEVAERVWNYDTAGSSTIFWAANNLMARYVSRHHVPETVTLVDSNPSKSGALEDLPIVAPEMAIEAIRGAAAIFIFTKFYSADILQQIKERFGKVFEPKHIHVVDIFGQ